MTMVYQDWVSLPLSWAIKPGSGIFTTKLMFLVFAWEHNRCLCIAPKMHAEHFGMLACVSLLGNKPFFVNVCRSSQLR